MSIFKFFKFFYSLIALIAMFLSIEMFLCFSIFFIVFNICELIMNYKNLFFLFVFKFIVICITIIFYIRPLVLYQSPEHFQFASNLGAVNSSDIINALWKITLYSCLILIIFTILSARKNIIVSGNTWTTKLKSQFENSKVLYKLNYVINLLVFLSCLRFFINALLGVGIKGQLITSSSAFLVRFAPEEFIVGISLALLFLYTKQMSKSQRLRLLIALILLSISFLATGSKAVFLLLIIFFVFIYMYMNVSINKPKLLLYTVAVVIIIPISFLLGNAVKLASYIGPLNVNNVITAFGTLIDTTSVDLLMSNITGRLIGFDGMLALDKMSLNSLYDIYSISNTMQRSFGMLVPFISSDLMTSGEAVSKIVAGLPEDAIHAGAIGGYAGIGLTASGYIFIGMFLFIVMNIIILRFLLSIKDPFSRMIQFFFYCFFLLFSLMSGNFDYCIAIYIIKIILYKIYFYPVFRK